MIEKESTLGERLLKARKEKKLSQAELGEKIFVSDKTISSWESNRTVPDLDTLAKISVLLEVRITDLLYGNNLRNDIETEIKIKLSDIEYKNLKLDLDRNGKFLKEIHQKDTYYSPKFRDFLAHEYPYEWLRIGQRGNQIIVNYKHWYPEGTKINTHCDEYEVEIDDATNMDKIFKVLDLEVIAVVDKMRKKYMYKNKYEVSLDYVESLGYFIEIEVKNYSKDALIEYDELIKLARDLKLDLSKLDKRGYPYHLLYEDLG